MTNKLLLAAIAFGLWANAVAPLIRPGHAGIGQPDCLYRRRHAFTREWGCLLSESENLRLALGSSLSGLRACDVRDGTELTSSTR